MPSTKMKKFFSASNRLLSRAENLSIGIALLGATFMITINVVNRFVFHKAFSWSDEMVRYLIIYVTFIGGAGCVRKQEHIAIDLLSSFIKNEKALRALSIIVGAICLLFSAAITVYGVQLVEKVIRFPQLTAGLRIPQYVPYIMIPVGFALMTLRYAQDLAGKLMGVDVFAEDHKKIAADGGEGGEA